MLFRKSLLSFGFSTSLIRLRLEVEGEGVRNEVRDEKIGSIMIALSQGIRKGQKVRFFYTFLYQAALIFTIQPVRTGGIGATTNLTGIPPLEVENLVSNRKPVWRSSVRSALSMPRVHPENDAEASLPSCA